MIIMALLRRTIKSLLPISINNSNHLRLHIPHPSLSKSLHSETESSNCNAVVTELCNSLRKGINWDNLNRRFNDDDNSVDLNDSIIEKVLLELMEPDDAKRALKFFHWSANWKNVKHGVWIYSIAIHILVRARMFIDAQALLVSVVKKNGSFSSFSVVDSLLQSYKIAVSNPVVFDMLVQIYGKLKMFDEALEACYYLEEHGFYLSIKSYNILICVVQKSEQCDLVWKFYEHLIQRRIYPNEESIKPMIGALCKEGKLQSIVEMLDRIHGKRCSPMVIVNASLVYRIMEEEEDGRIKEGMVLLKRMLHKNMILDTIAFSLIVYAKVKLGTLESAWEVFEEMLKRGFHANSFVYTSFIGANCRDGKIEEAMRLMQEMEDMGLNPYDETFNYLIEGCAKVEKHEDSLRFCEKMIERGLVPSCLAFNEMAGRLCTIGDVKRANAMLTVILDKGFLPDEITYAHLIVGYGKAGEVQEVLKLYHEMEYRSMSPGLLAFTSLIKSLCNCGKLGEAEKYLKIMKDRSLAPSVCVYETLIASNFEKGDKERALHLYNELISEGLKSSCSYFLGANAENLRKG